MRGREGGRKGGKEEAGREGGRKEGTDLKLRIDDSRTTEEETQMKKRKTPG